MKILAFLKMEFRYLFQAKLSLVGYLFGLILNLMAYYFTAKAFVPATGLLSQNAFLGNGYFEFIIIGEMCLLIPQVAVGDGQESFFRFKETGLLEQLYFSRLGWLKSLFSIYFSQVLIKLIFIVISLLLSALFFKLVFTPFMFLKFLLAQLMASVFFLGLYFLNLSISTYVGRRNASLHHLVTLLTFFSGAYFPLEIFHSEALVKILSHSPFALQVLITREFIYSNKLNFENVYILFLWGLLPFVLSYGFFQTVLKKNLGRVLC